MARPSATTLLFHVNGTNPCMDSAYAPTLSAVVVRPLADESALAQRFGGNGASEIVGQSYEPGAHPPR
jgi:hypothetical protein